MENFPQVFKIYGIKKITLKLEIFFKNINYTVIGNLLFDG